MVFACYETLMNWEIDDALKWLRSGKVIAFPTETVWGLAALAREPAAVNRLYALKHRSQHKPCQIMVPSAPQALKLVRANAAQRRLMQHFMPGPLTMIMPVRAGHGLCERVVNDAGGVGVRIPNHPVPLRLLHAVDAPLAVSSANISGLPPFQSAAHVKRAFGVHVMVCDGRPQPNPHGLASTVIDVMQGNMEILREGALSLKALQAVANRP